MLFGNALRFLKEIDGRVRIMIAGFGIYQFNTRLSIQYNQIYARLLGASYVALGAVSGVGSVVNGIMAIPIGLVADKYGFKKVILLGLIFAAATSAIYSFSNNWILIIPAMILGVAPIIGTFADIIFITYTNPERRGIVVAFSRLICGSLSMFAPMIAAVVLAYSGGITTEGIRPLYYIQLVLAVFVLVFVAFKLQILKTKSTYEKAKSPLRLSTFAQYFRELFEGEKWLKRWMLIGQLRLGAAIIASPFINIWMIEVKGADPYVLGIMGTIGVLGSIFLIVPVGKLADRIGRKKTFYLLEPFKYLGIIVLILAPNPQYLILAGLLGGTAFAGTIGGGIGGLASIPYWTMHHEMVPAGKRGRWFSLAGIFHLQSLPLSILSGYLWQNGLMVPVLLVPVLVGAFLVIPIITTVPDTLGRLQ